jgi:hypothetical protein
MLWYFKRHDIEGGTGIPGEPLAKPFISLSAAIVGRGVEALWVLI